MTHPLHSTELLRTRDRSSALLLIDHYTRLFAELRATLPREQTEAVEAILCGPFYDGPQRPRRQHKPSGTDGLPAMKCDRPQSRSPKQSHGYPGDDFHQRFHGTELVRMNSFNSFSSFTSEGW